MGNGNSLRHLLVQLNDVFIREPQLIWRYYRPFASSPKAKRNVFMVDGRVGHGGMFDRLKGIISVYAISKAQQKDFRIHFSYPFELEKYLEPNEYDWRIDAKTINYHFPSARPLFLYGECYSPRRLFKLRNGEAHFYFGYNILDEVNARYGTNFEWGQLYRELFRPTSYLQQYIDKYQAEIGTDYVVFHARFLNLLGDKVELSINPELPEAESIARALDHALAGRVITKVEVFFPRLRSPLAPLLSAGLPGRRILGCGGRRSRILRGGFAHTHLLDGAHHFARSGAMRL